MKKRLIFKPDVSLESLDEPDVININVPLFIRMLEYAREEAKNDADLHIVTEKLIELCKSGKIATMDDYENII